MQDFIFYLKLGWEHIINFGALDHQLFILALVSIFSFKDWKKVLILVTAFTIGHSFTLVLCTVDIIRFSTKWVEFLIPCTIIFTVLDHLIFINNEKKLILYNYFLALFFGLIHGMGFANSVRMMLAKEQTILLPLFGFNVGLEIGQIILVMVFLMIFYLFFRFFKIEKKKWVFGVSSLILIIALKMAIERLID